MGPSSAHGRNVKAGHLEEIFGTYGKLSKVDLGIDQRVNLPKVKAAFVAVPRFSFQTLRSVFFSPLSKAPLTNFKSSLVIQAEKKAGV